DDGLEDDAVDWIVAKAEGNPLFIGEYWRHLGGDLDADAPPAATRDLPTTIDSVIGSRLAALSPAGRAMGDVAAVLGREFDYHVLAHTVGNARALGDEALLDALDEAARRRIVLPMRGVTDRYRFAHALVRDAAYQRLSVPGRAELHRQAGESFEQLFAG